MFKTVHLLLKKYNLWLLTLAVIATRLPFLAYGFGLDADSWRVANASAHLAATSEYIVSRFPGYPVQEISLAPLIGNGFFLSNLITAVFSAGAFLVFTLILRKLNFKSPLLTSLALVLIPVVYINSTVTIDYVWALFFDLLCLLMVLYHRPVWAGLAIGLAIGCRITSGALLLPYLLLMLLNKEKWKNLVVFSIAGLVSGLLIFLPVLVKYGSAFFIFYDVNPDLNTVARTFTLDVWGPVGGLAIVGCILSILIVGVGLRRTPHEKGFSPVLISAGLAAVLFFIAFFRLPHDAGYLIPALPFLLIILNYYTHPRLWKAVCILLLISSFVSFGNNGIQKGPVLEKLSLRQENMRSIQRIVDRLNQTSGRSVLISGPSQPLLQYFYSSTSIEGKIIVYQIRAEEILNYETQGYQVYYLPGQEVYTLRYKEGPNSTYIPINETVDVRLLGAQPLMQ